MIAPEHPDIEVLLNPSTTQLESEKSLLPKGMIPERWIQIENVETLRITTRLGQALEDRKKSWPENELKTRQETTTRYFKDLMLEPSFEGGPYASEQWLNVFEMIPRIVDIKQDESIVPDVDGRVPFKSLGLDKDMIISKWLINQIQASLPDGEKLRDKQLSDCFTNVSPVQLNTVVEQIAKSGLTLLPESPKEHWARIVNETTTQ